MHDPFFENREFLKTFDIDRWAAIFVRGQAAFRGAGRGIRTHAVQTILWNPEDNAFREGSHCVAIHLEDGSVKYTRSRNRLDRCSKAEAEKRARKFSESFIRTRAAGDPVVYTSVNWVFGPYSALISAKEPSEECIECVSAEAVKYTEEIGRQFPSESEYYAPLMYLVDEESDEPFEIGGQVVFLTNPLDLDRMLRNWSQAGVESGAYEIRVLEDDNAVDTMFSHIFRRGKRVVVDPTLHRAGYLASGFPVESLTRVKRKLKKGKRR